MKKSLVAQALGISMAFGAVHTASAVWWKDYTDDHDINNTKNWYGAAEWTPEQAAELWPTTSITFETEREPLGGWTADPYTAVLSGALAVQNIETGHDNARVTLDLNGHTLTTTHSDWGFFIKQLNAQVDIVGGTLSVTGKVCVGYEKGENSTLRIAPDAVLLARTIGVGNSNDWSTHGGNTLEVDGGKMLIENGWGFAVGENPGEDGGSLYIHNGGVVSNFCNSAAIGQKSANNSLIVTDGGEFYTTSFSKLGSAEWDWNTRPTNNLIKAENGGLIHLGSGFYISDGTNPDPPARNIVWAGDNGRVTVGGDVNINGSETLLVVSNGYFFCNSLHGKNTDYRGTRLLCAGANPVFETLFYFEYGAESTFHFDVPTGGYTDSPILCRGNCEIFEDTEMTFDVSKVFKGTELTKLTVPLMYAGNTITVPDDDGERTKLKALVEKWSAGLPQTARLILSEDYRTLSLELKKKRGMVVMVR